MENQPSGDGDEKKPVRFPLYHCQIRAPDTAGSNLAESSAMAVGDKTQMNIFKSNNHGRSEEMYNLINAKRSKC